MCIKHFLPSSHLWCLPSFFCTVIGAVNLVGKKRRGERLPQRSASWAVILKVCVAFHGSTDLGNGFVHRYWMLGAGALGWPRGMVWRGRKEEGSGCGTHVCLWRIRYDIWQNQYNIVKFKNKIKFKKNNKKRSVESELPWFVPSLMGKAASVSPLNVSYSGFLFIYLFLRHPLLLWESTLLFLFFWVFVMVMKFC